jgi:ATP-dependent Clp protease ATP-binding subunit ClpA
MFELYTEKARRAIFFARYEASQEGAELIEEFHLLLGILREERGILTGVIADPDYLTAVRTDMQSAPGTRQPISTSVDLPFSARCKTALTLAAARATGLGHEHISGAHLLLGLLELPDSRTLRSLSRFATPESLRTHLETVAANVLPPNDPRREMALGESFGALEALWRNAQFRWEFRLLMPRLARHAYTALTFALHEASQTAGHIGEADLFLGCMQAEPGLRMQLFPPPADIEPLRARVHEVFPPPRARQSSPSPEASAPTCKLAVVAAIREADRLGHKTISSAHLLLGLIRPNSVAERILTSFGVPLERARAAVEEAAAQFKPDSPTAEGSFRTRIGLPAEGTMHGHFVGARQEGRTSITESTRTYGQHDINVTEKWTVSEDGKKLTYSHEITGPGKTERHETEFEL